MAVTDVGLVFILDPKFIEDASTKLTSEQCLAGKKCISENLDSEGVTYGVPRT